MDEVGLKEWEEGGKKEGVEGVGVGGKRFVFVFLSFSLLLFTLSFLFCVLVCGEEGRRDGSFCFVVCV